MSDSHHGQIKNSQGEKNEDPQDRTSRIKALLKKVKNSQAQNNNSGVSVKRAGTSTSDGTFSSLAKGQTLSEKFAATGPEFMSRVDDHLVELSKGKLKFSSSLGHYADAFRPSPMNAPKKE